MYARYKKSGNASGKWQRVPHTGVGGLTREQVGDWVLDVTHRRQARSVQRDHSPRIAGLRRTANRVQQQGGGNARGS